MYDTMAERLNSALPQYLNSALPQYLGPLSIERRMKTLGHVLFYNHAAAQKPRLISCVGDSPAIQSVVVFCTLQKWFMFFFFFAEVLFRRRSALRSLNSSIDATRNYIFSITRLRNVCATTREEVGYHQHQFLH